MDDDTDRSKMTRRHFLFALGSLGGLAISGWTLNVPGSNATPAAASVTEQASGPRLRSGLAVVPAEFGAEIYAEASRGLGGPVCAVNRVGLRVIEQMDGKRTVEDIARDLFLHLECPGSDPESFKASVAMFMAELGDAGLLSAPFFVNIHSREVSA